MLNILSMIAGLLEGPLRPRFGLISVPCDDSLRVFLAFIPGLQLGAIGPSSRFDSPLIDLHNHGMHDHCNPQEELRSNSNSKHNGLPSVQSAICHPLRLHEMRLHTVALKKEVAPIIGIGLTSGAIARMLCEYSETDILWKIELRGKDILSLQTNGEMNMHSSAWVPTRVTAVEVDTAPGIADLNPAEPAVRSSVTVSSVTHPSYVTSRIEPIASRVPDLDRCPSERLTAAIQKLKRQSHRKSVPSIADVTAFYRRAATGADERSRIEKTGRMIASCREGIRIFSLHGPCAAL